MTQEPVRVALVGTGGIARAHVKAVNDVNGLGSSPKESRRAQQERRIELVAAVEVDPERLDQFCTEYDIAGRYTDIDRMLEAERPQLVLICTPPGVHCELSVRSMDAGAWVLCEKPLCASLAELDRIEEAEARNQVYCSSVFQWRFGSAGQHFKELIEAGALGKPLVCNTLITWYRTPEYYAVPWRGKWETELGGTTMGHGIHAIDFVLWLLGDWQEVRAMMGTLDREIEVEDVSMATVRFANGAMANITCSALSPRQSSYLRFDFQKATVELTHLYRYGNENWAYSIPEGAPYEEELRSWQTIGSVAGSSLPVNEDLPSSHAGQLASLLVSMARQERPAVSAGGVRGTIEFLTGMYKSAQTGLPVAQGSITPEDRFYHSLYGGDAAYASATLRPESRRLKS